MNRIGRLLSLAVLAIGGLTQVGCSSSSDGTPVTPPGAPTGLTATAAAGAVGLTWTPTSGATSYSVYRGTATGLLATKTKLAGSPTSAAFTDTTVTNDVPYFYQVTASNSGGESAGSNEATATPSATAPPAAPTGVTATPAPAQVSIAWSNVPNATSYNVYWSTSPGVTTASPDNAVGATSPRVVAGLTNGTTYYFIVTALNANGESAASLEVSATPDLPPPYIVATVIRWPMAVTGVPILEVEIFTSDNRMAPVTNATVTVSGTNLPYDAPNERYAASSPMPALGSTVTLSVVIPAGGAVASGTYTASGTMYTTAPMVTSPASMAMWTRSNSNTMTWVQGAPTATSPASACVVGIQNTNGDFFPSSTNGGPLEVPVGTTSYTLPANTLPAAGTYFAWVGIAHSGIVDGAGAGIPIANALAGSGLRLGAVSPIMQFTAN